MGPAIREVVALGFVEITEAGRAGNAEWRKPNLFRLTYRHTKYESTNDWEKIKTPEEAEALAQSARAPRPTRKNKTQCRKAPVFAERDIVASELFDGRLQKFGVREHGQARENYRCLTDGKNCLGVRINDAGYVTGFRREWNGKWGSPEKILSAVSDAFETKIFSYREPEYYGLKSEEEKAAWRSKQTELEKWLAIRKAEALKIDLTLPRSIGNTDRHSIHTASVQTCQTNINKSDENILRVLLVARFGSILAICPEKPEIGCGLGTVVSWPFQPGSKAFPEPVLRRL
jgi:hypothetical protein